MIKFSGFGVVAAMVAVWMVPCVAAAEPLGSLLDYTIQPHEASKLFAEDAFLLAFRPGLSDSQKLGVLKSYGLISDPNCRNPHFVRALMNPIELANGVSVTKKIEQLQRNPVFRYVEPDFVLIPEQVATDPNFATQYGLHNTGQNSGLVDADIDAVEGWPLVSDALPPVVIAALDNGTDTNHQDLAANIWINPGEVAGDGIDNDSNGFIDDDKGWDFSNNDRSVLPTASNTHGTHVTGIIGMVRNNGFGGAGAAKNVRMMTLQIAGGATSFYSALANAVDYASLNGAKVITLSYTIDSFSQAYSDAIGRAAARDTVYINSGGNAAINVDNLRGILRDRWSNVLIVASSTNLDTLSSFSNYGETVDIAAPGSSIYATYPNNTYATISGTSMAAPMVAAVVGQIRQVYPTLTAAQAIMRARMSADRIFNFGGIINGGRANLASALQADAIAPSAPTALTVLRRSHSAIELRFGASGDDGGTGAATNYDIRVSRNPIDAGNFGSAEKITNNLGGTASGSLITTQATGLVPGATYYVAVQALDNVGNVSALSTVGPVRMVQASWIDDVEGAAKWSTSGTWATTNAVSWSGARSWTDSPVGNYANSTNNALTMINPVVLPAEAIFRFRIRHAMEWALDFLTVELSADNGATWNRVGSYSGGASIWKTYTCSLSAWAGQSVKLRMRLTSDGSVTQDGVYVDDLSIVPGSRVWFDNVEGADNFAKSPTSSQWAKTTTQSFSPSNSWTDSPSGNSSSNSEIWLRGTSAITPTTIGDPEMSFMMRSAYRTSDYFTAAFSLNSGSTWCQPNSWPSASASWGSYTAKMPNDASFRVGFRYTTASGTTQDGVYLDNIAVFGEPFWSTISGTLTRTSYIGSTTVRPVTVDVLGAGNALLGSYPVALASSPTTTYELDTPHLGTFTLVYRAPGFISRRQTGIVMAWNTSIPAIVLPNGDVDGSGEIDAADIDQVIARFGAILGDLNYTANADVDGSGEIDAADIDVAIANFGAVND